MKLSTARAGVVTTVNVHREAGLAWPRLIQVLPTEETKLRPIYYTQLRSQLCRPLCSVMTTVVATVGNERTAVSESIFRGSLDLPSAIGPFYCEQTRFEYGVRLQ